MRHDPVSFIFKLGKHRSLPLRPLRQLSAPIVNPSLPPPDPLTMSEAAAKTGQMPHSNQMSS